MGKRKKKRKAARREARQASTFFGFPTPTMLWMMEVARNLPDPPPEIQGFLTPTAPRGYPEFPAIRSNADVPESLKRRFT